MLAMHAMSHMVANVFPNDMSSTLDMQKKQEELERQERERKRLEAEEEQRQQLLSADERERGKQILSFEKKIKDLETLCTTSTEQIQRLTNELQGLRQQVTTQKLNYDVKVLEVDGLHRQIASNETLYKHNLANQKEATEQVELRWTALSTKLSALEKTILSPQNDFPAIRDGQRFYLINQSARTALLHNGLKVYTVEHKWGSERNREWTISKVDRSDVRSAWTISSKVAEGASSVYLGFYQSQDGSEPLVRARKGDSEHETQEWLISSHPHGVWYIQNKWSNKYLDSAKDEKFLNWAPLRATADRKDAYSMRWILISATTS